MRDAKGAEREVDADQVLVAIGRRPRTEGWGLERLRLDMDGRFIKVDAQCRTSMRNVWAIGDVTGEPMLAHRASAQGEMVAEIIGGARRRFDPVAIPAVVFTDPEVVTVGQSPDDAAGAGIECIHAQFPFTANGRALTLEGGEGFVRVVARRDNHLIVGWQAVGRGVSELAAVFAHGAGDGRAPGRRRRHHPRPPDAGRGGARSRAARARPRAERLSWWCVAQVLGRSAGDGFNAQQRSRVPPHGPTTRPTGSCSRRASR